MEKHRAHYSLTTIKALIAVQQVRATKTALMGATALGLDFAQMLAIINNLTAKDFYKSMTTHADHTVWQDVYRPITSAGQIYLKLTVIDDLLIVSFKEL